MYEPIYGLDADGVMHYWYSAPASKWTGWSGCGQKERGDFASFAYTIKGSVTCIGCLSGSFSEFEQGLLRDLSRSIQALKAQGVYSDIEIGTIAHEKMAAQCSQAVVEISTRITESLGIPAFLLEQEKKP